jgi:hypothetical protein
VVAEQSIQAGVIRYLVLLQPPEADTAERVRGLKEVLAVPEAAVHIISAREVTGQHQLKVMPVVPEGLGQLHTPEAAVAVLDKLARIM